MIRSLTNFLDERQLERNLAGVVNLNHEVNETLLSVIKTQNQLIEGFYDAIQHGDEGHKKWLKDLVQAHINLYKPTLFALSDRLERIWARTARKD